jgi:large subunit ribosomal protein L18
MSGKKRNSAVRLQARHERVRKRCSSGHQQRPRLCVHRSLNNLIAQVVDDSKPKSFVWSFNAK